MQQPQDNRIPGLPGACQVSQQGQAVYLVEAPRTKGRGTKVRAERTPGAVVVSGICGESGESLKSLPDFPKTNSELPLSRGSFSVSGAVGWLLPRVNSPRWDRPGPG